MEENWKLVNGAVDPSGDYFKIVYGDYPYPYVLLAKGEGKTFILQLFPGDTSSDAIFQTAIEEIAEEIKFYMLELGEIDPWAYAKYHTTTASNLYSDVHWHYFKKGQLDDSGEARIIRVPKGFFAEEEAKTKGEIDMFIKGASSRETIPMTETTNDKLYRILRKCFETNDFQNADSKIKLVCPKKGIGTECCSVDIDSEPIYTPYFGNEQTKIMVIAEAPSLTAKRQAGKKQGGVCVGGRFDDIKEDKASPLYRLRNFIKDTWNTTPYFTDMVKCGFANQRVKAKLEQRISNCSELLLFDEIKALNPNKIFCIGNRAKKLLDEHKDMFKGIDVFKLIHYSGQGQLQLTIEDKVKFIWRIQSKILREEELNNLKLTGLECIRKLIKDNYPPGIGSEWLRH
jgi:uracil-DNA glycosylase